MSGRGGGRGGRGEYYRQKYGGGGRGRGCGGGGYSGGGDGGGNRGGSAGSDGGYSRGANGPVRSAEDLRAALRRIDGAGYGAYRDLEGAFEFSGGASPLPFRLHIDRTQSDPFAPPSRMHLVVAGQVAAFPAEAYSNSVRQAALADYLARMFVRVAKEGGDDQRTESGGWSGAKGGEISMEAPGQHVLERTNVMVHANDGSVEARFTVALPARGRSIEGRWCEKILCERMPQLVSQALVARALNAEHLRRHVLSVEDQETLRSLLPEAGAVAFVRNRAILPRKSGNTDEPMPASSAIPFQSPPSLEKEVTLPNCGKLRGMLIPRGITLIVGGGFHGKSTLLQALEVGCYNHIPGDGREFVCVNPCTVKIRAEDGRSVTQANITPFIDNLPFGKSTDAFSTPDASGSTSQATNIIEALEVGAEVLLMDEDTCATNFMIRDQRMQMLVAKDKEPITPFIAKVEALYNQLEVSSILVIGGSGDYFDVAHNVIMMDCYTPADKTQEAKAISQHFSEQQSVLRASEFGSRSVRLPVGHALRDPGKVTARGRDRIQFGDQDIDVSAVEQIVEVGQTRAIGSALKLLGGMAGHGPQPTRCVRELVEAVDSLFEQSQGLDALEPDGYIGTFSKPRKFEVAAALNRFRGLECASKLLSA